MFSLSLPFCPFYMFNPFSIYHFVIYLSLTFTIFIMSDSTFNNNSLDDEPILIETDGESVYDSDHLRPYTPCQIVQVDRLYLTV